MKITHELIEHLKNQTRADVFRVMAQPGAQEKAFEQLAAQSDETLNSIGRVAGIPEQQLPIFRAQFRGTDNEFTTGLLAFAGKLQPGDIVLMTGTSLKSRALAASQKAVYPWARSSHVGIMHAELVCIDAIPGVGVSNRLLTEVLHGTADDWRVIRFNDVDDSVHEGILKRCAYYLQQPYKIRPSRESAKSFSYCSELARKVLSDCKVRDTGIPKKLFIQPGHFDRLADSQKTCKDITESIRPHIEFLIKYERMFKWLIKPFVDGLDLNRSRFADRANFNSFLRDQEVKGRISPRKLAKLKQGIKETEGKLNFKFWDFPG